MRSYDFNCTLEFGEAVDSSNKEYWRFVYSIFKHHRLDPEIEDYDNFIRAWLTQNSTNQFVPIKRFFRVINNSPEGWHHPFLEAYQPTHCSYLEGLEILDASTARANKLIDQGGEFLLHSKSYIDFLNLDIIRHKKALAGDPRGLLINPVLISNYKTYRGVPEVDSLLTSYADKICGEKTNFKAISNLFRRSEWGPVTRSRIENIRFIKHMTSKLRNLQFLADHNMVRSDLLLKSLKRI
jgi:hypothetical protein